MNFQREVKVIWQNATSPQRQTGSNFREIVLAMLIHKYNSPSQKCLFLSRETTLYYFVGHTYAMLYMRCGLIMATLMVAVMPPNHIALYKSSLPPGDPSSYNRPKCHPWVEKLGLAVAQFHTPNGISIGSAVLQGLRPWPINRQTDKRTDR